MSNQVYISFGGNVGNSVVIFQQSMQEVAKSIGKVISKSSLYQTSAWGNVPQPDFLNQIICVESDLTAEEVLRALQQIENAFGRERTQKWGPRTLDLDLLLFNQEIYQTADLSVPHPQIPFRKFILIPLLEINKALLWPINKQPLSELLEQCEDQEEVKMCDFPI